MFKTKPELQAIHKALSAYADTLDRGDSMPFEQIETISGIERYEGSWNHIVKCLKRHLENSRGIAIWPKFNGSYSLLTAPEQANDLPRWEQKRARRRLRRTRNKIKMVDQSLLSPHQRLVAIRQIEYLEGQSKQLYRGINDGLAESKTKTLPRRPVTV